MRNNAMTMQELTALALKAKNVHAIYLLRKETLYKKVASK